mmetsp:Transcript_15971/g.51551  ORF Transcript_15971/g.51551 Transcript_15971/m.51551 type:complete len:219 (-) Transcript_15971:126-782(-)
MSICFVGENKWATSASQKSSSPPSSSTMAATKRSMARSPSEIWSSASRPALSSTAVAIKATIQKGEAGSRSCSRPLQKQPAGTASAHAGRRGSTASRTVLALAGNAPTAGLTANHASRNGAAVVSTEPSAELWLPRPIAAKVSSAAASAAPVHSAAPTAERGENGCCSDDSAPASRSATGGSPGSCPGHCSDDCTTTARLAAGAGFPSEGAKATALVT